MGERKVATELIAIIAVFFATILGAFGAIYFKKGSRNVLTLRFKNTKLFYGLVFYSISALMFIWALKRGELSILYPITSLSYVWVSFLSIVLVGERMNKYKWIGILFIILGVSLIGFGA